MCLASSARRSLYVDRRNGDWLWRCDSTQQFVPFIGGILEDGNIFPAGEAGNGQAAKIANNMLLGVSMIATCEAFNLAESLGLDAQTFFDISSKASGQCWSMTTYCPAPGPVPTAPSNRDYQPGFSVAMMLKDLRLATAAAAANGAPVDFGRAAEQAYAALAADGHDQRDFSVPMLALKGAL